jgi:IS605 OrfB family transposase
MRGKETRWMRNRNHVISKRIVEIAAQYDNPVIVFENLTGLRNRAKGSERFNRMLSSWAFRELLDFVEYKAARLNIPVIRADPRNTSKMCSRCGYASRHNRRKQGLFYCHRCGFEHNADANAAINIAARGPVNGPTSKGLLTSPDPWMKFLHLWIRLPLSRGGPMWSSVQPKPRFRLVTKPQPSHFPCEFPVGTFLF